ncbi:MAG: hypothetical protein Q9191_003396 [Dirinaria sp. TL-2023a]
MAEAVAAIGALAAITQLIDHGTRLVTRLNEFSSVLGYECPSLFQDIRVRLPLVLNVLEHMQLQTQKSQVNDKLNTVQPLIESTSKNVLELLRLVEKIVNLARGSGLKKTLGVIRSLLSDKKVKRLGERLQTDMQILMFYQSVNAFDLNQKIAQHLSSVTGFTRDISKAKPSNQDEDIQQECEDLVLRPRAVTSSQDSPSSVRVQDSIQDGVILSLRQSMSPISPSSHVPSFGSSRNGDLIVDVEASRQLDACPRSCSCSAFTFGRKDICKFLLTEGADASIEADNGSNVIERAWLHAQSNSKTPGGCVMFDNDILQRAHLDDFLQSQQYNTIHKIVLGISRLPLSQFLESSTSQIDGRDIRGNSPLYWASVQGNVGAARTLLEKGANVNQRGAVGQTPLHIARTVEMTQLLLRSGADMESRDDSERTPLHCFCYRQIGASASVVQALLEAGAQVMAVAYGGQTALHYAAMFGNTCLIPLLRRFGADINALQKRQTTPVMAAVRYDKYEAIEALLDSSADASVLNQDGQSILHMAALYSDIQSLCVLTNVDYSFINADAKDTKGFSPRDYYDQRRERTPSLDAAFDRLMHLAGESTHELFNGPRKSDRRESSVGIAAPRSDIDANNLRIPGSFIAP